MTVEGWQILLFFLVALAYSSVGLGGGSSYTALLVLLGASSRAIPTISLMLNLAVTSIGSANFIRHGHARRRLILPLLASSIPMAYVGGLLPLSERAFQALLLCVMLLVVLRIYSGNAKAAPPALGGVPSLLAAVLLGAPVGFVAGAAGIGGGILLVPLVLMFGLGDEREAAASGAIVIWFNSAVGLLARVRHHAVPLDSAVPLLLAVIFGATLGSQLGAGHWSPGRIQRVLGLIVLLAVLALARGLVAG